MYQQHNNQLIKNLLHQPQYYPNNYQQNQQHNYNPTQFSNVSHNQSQVSKFAAHQHCNQQQQHQLRQQNEYQPAVQALHSISQDISSAATTPSGHYQQNQQHQQSVERQTQHQQSIERQAQYQQSIDIQAQHQQSIERQAQHQQILTPPPLINQYSLPINPFHQQHLRENNISQFQYQRFPTWIKPKTQTNVSNSVCPQQLGTNVQFNQYAIRSSLSVDSTNSASIASWHRPTETQQVHSPQQSVQSQSTIDSGSTTCSTSSSMPVLQNMGKAEIHPLDLTNLISYLKEPPPLVKIPPNTPDLSSHASLDDQISVRKISPQEVRRQEAPLRDLKKMYRLQKQSQNSTEVFRKPKEKYKPSILKSVSPKHRIASPDSTLLPEISQSKTIVSNVPSAISDDNCEPPLSPISDSDATVCYGKDDDEDESLKRRCQDFDSPVRELKSGSLKRSFNDGDVEYENIEKRIKMISPSRECDSTNEFVEEHMRNYCPDRLKPLTPDPIVGCVIYNDVFHVRYLHRDNTKFYSLNDIRPFLKQNKPLLKDIKPIQNYAMCTESEEKLLNWKYSSQFSFVVTTNMKFVAFEEDPEIHCVSISVKELTDNTNIVSEISDKLSNSAQEISHDSDLILNDTGNVVNKQLNNKTDMQPSPLTSVTLKDELDKLSGMAQEVIHSAFASLLEECRSLQEQNHQLTEKIRFKDEKFQSLEDLLREVSSLL